MLVVLTEVCVLMIFTSYIIPSLTGKIQLRSHGQKKLLYYNIRTILLSPVDENSSQTLCENRIIDIKGIHSCRPTHTLQLTRMKEVNVELCAQRERKREK